MAWSDAARAAAAEARRAHSAGKKAAGHGDWFSLAQISRATDASSRKKTAKLLRDIRSGKAKVARIKVHQIGIRSAIASALRRGEG